MHKGYTIRAIPAPAVNGKPAWHSRIRRKGWKPRYWVTVCSDYGPIVYTEPHHAVAAGKLWAMQNESYHDVGAIKAREIRP